jgi:hypothetical protein
MFRPVLTVTAMLFLVACGPKSPSAKLIDYGTYEATIFTTADGRIASVHGLKHQQTITRIPAEVGCYWGFRARLTNPLKRAVAGRVTIDHPEFTAPDGTKSSTETEDFELAPGDSITEEFLWFFIADCPYEFVPGTWSRRIFFDDREILRRDFEIYKP